jgi:hypothetical protein
MTTITNINNHICSRHVFFYISFPKESAGFYPTLASDVVKNINRAGQRLAEVGPIFTTS